jgi:hypothetical protein
MQNRAPEIIGAPHDGQDCWSGAPQLMQKRPAAGVGRSQLAQTIVSGVFMR